MNQLYNAESLQVITQVNGVYTLLFEASNDFSKLVGSLGRVHFEKGNYAYVGSAQSSLFPRLERHFRRKKRLHWHIDYLTSCKNISVEGSVYSVADSKETECELCVKLSKLSFSRAVPSFGSTDCRHGCESHLFILKIPSRHAKASTIEIYEELGLRPLLYQR